MSMPPLHSPPSDWTFQVFSAGQWTLSQVACLPFGDILLVKLLLWPVALLLLSSCCCLSFSKLYVTLVALKQAHDSDSKTEMKSQIEKQNKKEEKTKTETKTRTRTRTRTRTWMGMWTTRQPIRF